MSVDTVNRRLYFADSGNKLIGSVALDGSDYKTHIATGTYSQPNHIIAVPSLG